MPISNQAYSLTPIKRSYIHTAVSERFLNDNHSENHMLLMPIEKLKTGRDSIIEPPLSGQKSKSRNKCRKEWGIQPPLSGNPLLSGQQSKSRNKCRKEWGIQPLLSGQQSKSRNKGRKEWGIQPLLSGHPLLSGQQSKSPNKCRKARGIQPLLSGRLY